MRPLLDARRLWPAVAIATGLLIPGCGTDVTPPQPSLRDQAALHVVASVLPAMVNTLVVEVTAADMPGPLIFNIVASGATASGTITVPSGASRTLTIRAYDASGIETHRGSTTINVQVGANPLVSVALMPLQGQQPIDVRVEGLVVTVTPGTATMRVDQTVSLQAAVTTAGGAPVSVAPSEIRWATLQSGVATVGLQGSVLGVGAGTATIVAMYAGVGGAATITVQPSPILLAAGDVAKCPASLPGVNTGEQTARLLDAHAVPGSIVAMLGDGAYDKGTLAEFTDCYDKSWGRHKAKTRPAPGNHEYDDPGPPANAAVGYYTYFGAIADTDTTEGYYSYNLGAWHIVALNSEESFTNAERAAQVTWLNNDLAANPAKCTLLYWHHPRFSSGTHGNTRRMDAAFRAAYGARADLILVAHDHDYERFAPQAPGADDLGPGVLDDVRGVVQIVVGTGGNDPRDFSAGTLKPNSLVRIPKVQGVIKVELGETKYRWWFIAADGSVPDSGERACH